MGVNQERSEVIILKVLDCRCKTRFTPFSRRIVESDADIVAATVAAGGPFFFAATRRCSDSQVWA